MKLTIESTGKLTLLDGVPVLVWTGLSESGTRCYVFVKTIAVREELEREEFERILHALGPHTQVPITDVLRSGIDSDAV